MFGNPFISGAYDSYLSGELKNLHRRVADDLAKHKQVSDEVVTDRARAHRPEMRTYLEAFPVDAHAQAIAPLIACERLVARGIHRQTVIGLAILLVPAALTALVLITNILPDSQAMLIAIASVTIAFLVSIWYQRLVLAPRALFRASVRVLFLAVCDALLTDYDLSDADLDRVLQASDKEWVTMKGAC